MGGPKGPGFSGMGPIPNDEYGDGHMQVDPRFSRNTNRQAVYNNSSDGNIAAYEETYGAPGNEPTPYSGSPYGLSPAEKGMDQVANMRYAQLFGKGVQLFGEEGFAEIMDEVLRIAASQEANGTQVTSNLDTSRMPPADFGGRGYSGAVRMDPMSIIRSGAKRNALAQ